MKWLVLIVGNSLLIGAIAMAIVLTINPPAPPPVEVAADSAMGGNDIPVTPDEKLAAMSDEIDHRNSRYDSLLAENKRLTDSLNFLNMQVQGLELEIERQVEKATSIKELSKTFESMKSNEMAPILANLDSGILVGIYRNMSSRSRKKFMMALSDKRAAQITEMVVENPVAGGSE